MPLVRLVERLPVPDWPFFLLIWFFHFILRAAPSVRLRLQRGLVASCGKLTLLSSEATKPLSLLALVCPLIRGNLTSFGPSGRFSLISLRLSETDLCRSESPRVLGQTGFLFF